MKIKFYFMVLVALSLTSVYAQERGTEKRSFASEITMGGQFMVSTDGDNLFYNMGGGGTFVRFRQVALSVNFLPSLRYNFDSEKFTPLLGLGLQFHIKERIIIGMPLYFINDEWRASFGLGYKFLLSCPQ